MFLLVLYHEVYYKSFTLIDKNDEFEAFFQIRKKKFLLRDRDAYIVYQTQSYKSYTQSEKNESFFEICK